MTQFNFLVESRKLFSPRIWHWLILALRQDPLIWDNLENSDLGSLALKTLSSDPERWSPASLCLLALENPVSIHDLRTLPLNPLPQPLRGESAQTFEDWLSGLSDYSTLTHVGMLALSLRERFRLKGSWDGLFLELGDKLDNSASVFACLFGMIPEPMDFLKVIFSNSGSVSKSHLALHALLCNPFTAAEQEQVLSAILSTLPLNIVQAVLRHLRIQRPWLATSLSKQLLVESDRIKFIQQGDVSGGKRSNYWSDFSLEPEVGRLVRSLQEIDIYDLSDQNADGIPLIHKSIDAVTAIQANLNSQLARAISQDASIDSEDSKVQALDAWKQATRLAPGTQKYSAGLAKTLLEQDRLEDAQAYLMVKQTEATGSLHPDLLLISALSAARSGDHENFTRNTNRLLTELEKGVATGVDTYISLIELLMADQQYQKAAKATRLGLENFPRNLALLTWHAQALLASDNPSSASSSAFMAQAVNKISSEFLHQDQSVVDLDKLLIDCLEEVGDWETVLLERISLVERTESPQLGDFHNLANCAICAKEPQQAVAFCQQALEIDQEDGFAFGFLGEAHLLLGDYQSALDNFLQAARFAPFQPEFWIRLADTYKLTAQPEKVLEILRAASQELPGSPEIQLALGKALFEQNAATQALTHLRKAKSLLPANGKDVHVQRAGLSNVEYKVFKIDQNLCALIAFNLGSTLKMLGYTDEACQELAVAYGDIEGSLSANRLLIDDWDADGSFSSEVARQYAQTLITLEDFETAAEVLDTFTKINPEDLSAKFELARILMQLPAASNSTQRSIILLETVLGVEGEHDLEKEASGWVPSAEDRIEAQALLAEALAASGDYEAAKTVYRTSLESSMVDEPAWRARMSLGLGKVANNLGEPEMAVAALQEAVNIEPENTQIHRSLSEAYYDAGLYKDSLSEARVVRELAPSNLGSLIWFADQGLRLYTFSDEEGPVIKTEIIQALRSVFNEEPHRTDILVRIGESQVKFGDEKAAKKTFKKIAKDENYSSSASVSDLHKTAAFLRDFNEPDLAIDLLERIINRIGGLAELGRQIDHFELEQVLADLISIYEDQDDLASAVKVLDQAISADQTNPDLYLTKSKLLSMLGEDNQAITNLQSAIELFPENGRLKESIALLLHQNGDLGAALFQADAAVSMLNDSQDSEPTNVSILLAAQIARAMLQSSKAVKYLDQVKTKIVSNPEQFLITVCLAELVLEDRNPDEVSQLVTSARNYSPDHPRVLALRARFSLLNGEVQDAVDLLSQAVTALNNPVIVENELPEPVNPPQVLNRRAVAEAASKMGQWNLAFGLISEVVASVPQEPRSQLDLLKILVLRAEAQTTCQMLDISVHNTGFLALSEESRNIFERTHGTIVEQLQGDGTLGEQTQPGLDLAELQKEVNLWKVRGDAVFEPSEQNSAMLAAFLNETIVNPEDLGALLMVSNQIGNPVQASEFGTKKWSTDTANKDISEHPLILTQLALALSRINSQTAVETAMTALEKIQLTPFSRFISTPMVNYLLSKLAFQNKDYSIGVEAIRNALDVWVDEPEWNVLASKIFTSDDASSGLPDLSASIGYLRQAVELQPEDWNLHLELGKLYLAGNDNIKAVQAFEEVIEREPHQPEAWMLLSKAQQSAGRTDEALESVVQALEFAPDPVAPLLLRGEIELQRDNPADAKELAELVLRINPGEPAALYVLAKSLEALDQPDAALVVLDKGIAAAGESLPIQLERVKLIRKASGPAVAIDEVEQLAGVYPNDPKLAQVKAGLLMEAGKGEQAYLVAREALKMNEGKLSLEEQAELHYIMGHQMHEEGQLDQAVHHLSLAIQRLPGHLKSYLEIGQVYQERRQLSDALEIYSKAIDLSPNDFHAYYQAGLVLKDTKDYVAAEKVLKHAAQLAPEDTNIQRMLGAVVAINLVNSQRMAIMEA